MRIIIDIEHWTENHVDKPTTLEVEDRGTARVAFSIDEVQYWCEREELMRLLRALESKDVANARYVGEMIKGQGMRGTQWT